jgi:hypothetical protein
MPDRTINIHIDASTPYTVSVVKDSDTPQGLQARFIVQDVWGNAVVQPPQVNYTLIGDVTTNNQTQGTT